MKVKLDEPLLLQRIEALVRRYLRFGYRRIHALVRREGWHVNRKRVHRLWQVKGYKVPKKTVKKRRVGLSANGTIRKKETTRNDVWACVKVVYH